MNGLLNSMLFPLLLYPNLRREEQLMMGLSVKQSSGLIPTLLLKPLVDRLGNEETERAAAEKRAQVFASAIEIVVPLVTGQLQLRVPAATAAKFVRKDGTDGATLSEDGFVTFPDDEQPGDLTLAIAVDGVERPVVVRRSELSQIGVGTGATTRAAMRRTAARSAPHTSAPASSARGERAGIEATPRAPGDGPEERTGDIAQEEARSEQPESASDQGARRKSR